MDYMESMDAKFTKLERMKYSEESIRMNRRLLELEDEWDEDVESLYKYMYEHDKDFD